MSTSPVKNLIPPDGYYSFWTNGAHESYNYVMPIRMNTIFSPVLLNPRILVPRFRFKTYFTSGQIPAFFDPVNIPTGAVESRCGVMGAVTFPAVYHLQTGGIPAFGQIYPRGLG
jgi:hypothetical protein